MTNPINLLGSALTTTGMTLLSYLPNLIVSVLMLVIGWVFGTMLGSSVTHFLKLIKLDRALNQVGLDELSAKAGVDISVSKFFGTITKWAIIVSFALVSSEVLGLSQLSDVLKEVLQFIPSVVVATILLSISVMIGDAVGKVVHHSLQASSIKSGVAGSFAKWSIIILAGVFPALTELNIGTTIIPYLVIGIISAFAIAFGLAFGLGGKDHANQIIADIRKSQK